MDLTHTRPSGFSKMLFLLHFRGERQEGEKRADFWQHLPEDHVGDFEKMTLVNILVVSIKEVIDSPFFFPPPCRGYC